MPLDAIVRPPNDSQAFAVYVPEAAADAKDSTMTARLRRVSVGEVRGNEVEITKGLAVGDRVIVRGSTIVHDGSSIRVIP